MLGGAIGKLIAIAAALMVSSCLAGTVPDEGIPQQGRIRVLIQDKENGFGLQPKEGEKLKKLDEIDGRLVLGYTAYLGWLSIWKGDGGLYLVNSLPLEDYVKGVVKAELGRQWGEEALKAQAVASRTYVLSRLKRATRPEYHVTSSVLHQVYRGLNSDVDVEGAVDSTRAEVLTFKGKLIEAFYHSTSVGSTELPENVWGNPLEYLPSVKASGRLSPYAFWSRKVALRDFERAMDIEGLKDIKVLSRTAPGRADDVALVMDSSQKLVKATELRKRMGWRVLPSTDFTVHVEGGEAMIEGKGYGHGVGLCQWTALEMAMQGKNYKEILAHFYPGAEITIHEDR